MPGLTKRPAYSGQGVKNPEFPPVKGDYSPWTGGFPPNPTPSILPIFGSSPQQAPSDFSRSIASGLNPGKHLGWFKHRQSPSPIPIGIPNRFRITPPPIDFGARPSKLGGFHIPSDLHASIMPSNPLVFSGMASAKEQIQSTLNNNATLRGFVKKVIG
jgi:hypothetical protein